MINIAILTLKNAVMASIADAAYVFATVNELLENSGKSPLFVVKLVGTDKEVQLNNGNFSVKPDVIMDDLPQTDLIIIPSIMGDAIAAAYVNKDYASWIIDQYKQGAEVASLCTGAFLLAFTGLLRDRQCTTHWAGLCQRIPVLLSRRNPG